MIYNIKSNEFRLKRTYFANFVLADEINRACEGAISLTEAMQEKQVTIGDTTFKLDDHFSFSYAKPIEQEGTYQLPEAQVDRFMLKTVIDYSKNENVWLFVKI
jgi:MoxR-like ATPase